MASNRWFVQLKGHQFDLEALAEFLESGSIKVSREEDEQWKHAKYPPRTNYTENS